MGWEMRRSRLYYYRSQKVGGRVVKEYASAGLIGELAAELDAEQRAERQARAEGTVLSGSGWRRRRRRWSSCVGWRIR